MRPLTLCLSPGSVEGGGIGMTTLHLAEALLAEGHRVDLLHLGPVGARRLPAGCQGVALGARAREALPVAIRYLRRARPDLIVSARDYVNLMMLTARGLAGLDGREMPLVWSYHTHRASEMAHGAGRADRAADWLARQVLARASGRWRPEALVAVSQDVAQGLCADLRLPEGAVEVIENAVWTPQRLAARHAPCPHPWLAARAPMAAPAPRPPGEAVLVAVGRLVVQKDFATLLRAMALVPGPRLILLGAGPLEGALRAQIAAEGLGGRVDLAGQVDDVLPYLTRADLFVMPSKWEGFGLALVEALGCGIPVVASDCPGGMAAMLQNGALGRLVPIGAPEALAAAIAAALGDPGAPGPRIAQGLRYQAGDCARAYLALAQRLRAKTTAG